MKKRHLKYILKKIGQLVVVMIVLSIAVFIIARVSAGDPLKAYYGDTLERMSQQEKQVAREKLGLHESIVTQYTKWIKGAVKGDFGISYKYKQEVTSVISNVWVNTLILGGTSYIVTFLLAILIGGFCALREDSLLDRIICKSGVIINCIPSFFMALILILIFGAILGWLPTSGAYSLGGNGNIGDRITYLILPVTVMILSHLWYYAYMVRNKLIEETRQDYVLLCKVKGLSRGKIMFKHCLKNALPSIITIMAISVAHILGGTYVVEKVFSYPGLGTLSFESAKYQDYNMLLVLCLLTGLIVVTANIVGQIINEFIDPRMKYEPQNLIEGEDK